MTTITERLASCSSNLKKAETATAALKGQLDTKTRELAGVTRDIELIDPALVKADRYAPGRWTITRKICDVYYYFRNIYYKATITSLNGRVTALQKEHEALTGKHAIASKNVDLLREKLTTLTQKLSTEIQSLEGQLTTTTEQIRQINPTALGEARYDRSAYRFPSRWLYDSYYYISDSRTSSQIKPLLAEKERIEARLGAALKELEALQPSPMIESDPVKPATMDELDINFKVMLGALVSWTEDEKSVANSFSNYLYSRIFRQDEITKKEYDSKTHKFSMHFKNERRIELPEIPPDSSPEVKEILKMVKGTTLVIGKKVSGNFDIGRDLSINFDPGYIQVTWSFFSASLTKTTTKELQYLILTGSYLGASGSRKINAQDFVHMIEHNLQLAK